MKSSELAAGLFFRKVCLVDVPWCMELCHLHPFALEVNILPAEGRLYILIWNLVFLDGTHDNWNSLPCCCQPSLVQEIGVFWERTEWLAALYDFLHPSGLVKVWNHCTTDMLQNDAHHNDVIQWNAISLLKWVLRRGEEYNISSMKLGCCCLSLSVL